MKIFKYMCAPKVCEMIRLVFGVIGLVAVMALPNIASAIPFQSGDVFAGVGNGFIKRFDNNGNLIQTLDSGVRNTETTGMAFDSHGNLLATMFQGNKIVKFDNNGTLLGNFGSGFNSHPESISINTSGNVLVGQADGNRDVLKFSGDGTPQTSFNVATDRRGSDWIDLSSDQKTLLYTSEGTKVKAFDISTNTQLPDFSSSLDKAFALRILGDGNVLVANTNNIKRLDGSGNVIQTYNASLGSFLFALNLDPDNKTFWTADISTGDIFNFDINSGAELKTFNGGIMGSSLAGLAVFGEITQGGGGPANVPEPSILALLGIGFLGLGFLRKRQS